MSLCTALHENDRDFLALLFAMSSNTQEEIQGLQFLVEESGKESEENGKRATNTAINGQEEQEEIEDLRFQCMHRIHAFLFDEFIVCSTHARTHTHTQHTHTHTHTHP